MNTSGRKKLARSGGFSLLEVTMAMAIFAVAIGVTAQSLISYYAVMDMQNQRVVAMNQCRGILNQMRDYRDANPSTSALPANCITKLLAQYPPDTSTAGPAQLKNSTIVITYENTNPATANPLVPMVTLTWNDLRGRTLSVSLSTALADQ